MPDFRAEILDYLELEKEAISRLDIRALSDALCALVEACEREARIFTLGNGGSAATASHMVCDFNKGISAYSPKKFRMTCLSDNIPTLMAIANDISYEDVFAEQLRGELKKGDVVLAISGSGNSKNIIKAVEYAKGEGAVIIGMCGYDGGRLKELSDFVMHAEIDDMQISEDLHMVFDHMMMRVLCNYYGGEACGC
ncbi:MAG: SIS domain-containing protein [Oscillospiraceae bacterium]|nr:SIS domain-containing protein [Oscillospiraceae bacterium]